MTFHDLPPDWEHRSLEDRVLAADVLDLLVSDADRRQGGLAVLLLTPDGHLAQPVFLRIDLPVPAAERDTAVSRIARLARQLAAGTQVLASVVRESGPFVTDDDRAWHEALLVACRAEQVPLLGPYLVTRHVVRPFPLSLGRATA